MVLAGVERQQIYGFTPMAIRKRVLVTALTYPPQTGEKTVIQTKEEKMKT